MDMQTTTAGKVEYELVTRQTQALQFSLANTGIPTETFHSHFPTLLLCTQTHSSDSNQPLLFYEKLLMPPCLSYFDFSCN